MSVRRLDLALGALVLLLAAVLALAPTFLGGGERGVDGSAESAEPEGRRALFLVLLELGFEPELWDKAPGTLPRGEHVLWSAAPPMEFSELVEREFRRAGDDESSEEDEPSTADAEPPARPVHLELHELGLYRGFVEQGGTLVLPRGPATQRFLERIGLDPLAQADREAAPGAPFEPLVLPDVDPGERVAFAAPVGLGRIVLLADGGLSNEELRTDGGALRAVRLVEALDRGGRLLLDEYALGRWQPDTAIGLALSRDLRPVCLHALLLLAVLVWRASYPRAFPRDPEPLALFSPLSRARAVAALFERARRYDVLASWLLRGVLRRLGGAGGARGAEPPRDGESLRDGESPRDGESLGAQDEGQAWRAWAASILPAVCERAGAGALLERCRKAFLSDLPGDAAGLEALGAEIRALEAGLDRSAAPRLRRAAPLAGEGRLARERVSGIVAGR